jgi:hypothetical protein
MPPPALRAAQQQFWKALECAVEAVNAEKALAQRLLLAVQLKEASAGEETTAAQPAADGETEELADEAVGSRLKEVGLETSQQDIAT